MLKHHIFLFFLLVAINVNAFVKEVAPGIYVHVGKHLDVDVGYDGDICNIGFIVGKDSIAVIDSGGSNLVGQKLKKYITENFNQPIKYVINTHPHLDHIYGNVVFSEAEIYGHANLTKAMKSREEIYSKLNEKYLGNVSKDSPLILPNNTVEIGKDKIIDLGERQITLQSFPDAHTEADMIVFDQNTRTLWTGDLVFRERTPVIDGNIHGFIKALEVINNKEIDLVIPGHGQPSPKNEAIQPILNYLVQLRDDVRKFIDSGESLEFAMENSASSLKEQWLLFEIQNQRNVNRIFPMMEWE